MRAPPPEVEAYLSALPPAHRAALERLRRVILAAAPMATERISYRIPTFVHEGNLLSIAAFRDHCSFFPGAAGVELALASGLRGFETRKGTIQFPPERPLPAALVRKVVKARVAANEARAAKRQAKKKAKPRNAAPAHSKAAGKKKPARRAR